jgi:hypothetical protein
MQQIRPPKAQNVQFGDTRPIHKSTMVGFLHVALLKALALADEHDKPQIMEKYLAIKTIGEARQFMSSIAMKSRSTNLS